MLLVTIDGEADLTIHNISILPSDQCATDDQRASKCCCGDGRFYDYPTKKCKVSQNVGFMFGRLNDSWSHMVVYGFVYPILVIIMIAPLCAVLLGMGKREKREGDRRYVSLNNWPTHGLLVRRCIVSRSFCRYRHRFFRQMSLAKQNKDWPPELAGNTP
ncbi:unnamed protein product [Gongylonema pulchrum]|uniref:G_PROTEIN_RECEP_F2_4 domain-containing protein n=1 Tax=Gongylonema pulchrum TaxID=637853 RepID=A0A183EXZ5_9BILA|nr:unnamed protein product [Gongylonema pulchrum]